MIDGSSTLALPSRRVEASADSVRATYRGLRGIGWSEGEAGNLAAHLAGLTTSRAGWRMREVDGLLFIRSLVETGRLEP